MAQTSNKTNTVKFVAKKVGNNGDDNDYSKVPIGADSNNVDRPDGSTVEESLSVIENEKVEIIPVENLPESDIKVYPFIYALVKPSESKGIFYEYRENRWIEYKNGTKGIWIGTKEECAKDFDNIEIGTIVIIIKKKQESSENHTHDYVCQITKEPTYSQVGIKTYTCFLCGDTYTEEIPALIDSINPAGVIRIGSNEYATWKDDILFDTYYKDDQSVTIEATDNETGVKEIAYHLANAAVTESNIGTVTWTPYTTPFTIQPNNNYIVYARITDNADNVTYICSDGIVMDNIPPAFEGLEDGGTYPTGTVLTVEEGSTLTVNGNTVELTDNSYTFTEPMDNCLLSLSDRAGNVNFISINIEEIYGDDYSDLNVIIDNSNKTIKIKNIETLDLNNENINIYGSYKINGEKYKTIFDDSLSQFGGNNKNLKSVTFIGNFDTSNVADIKYMFYKSSLLEYVDFGNFDTSNVADMSYMFSQCNSLKTVNLNKFVTNKVTNMNEMFGYCSSLESLDLTSFNTENVTDASYMFLLCSKLKNVYVSHGRWNLANAKTDDIFYDSGISDVTYM